MSLETGSTAYNWRDEAGFPNTEVVVKPEAVQEIRHLLAIMESPDLRKRLDRDVISIESARDLTFEIIRSVDGGEISADQGHNSFLDGLDALWACSARDRALKLGDTPEMPDLDTGVLIPNEKIVEVVERVIELHSDFDIMSRASDYHRCDVDVEKAWVRGYVEGMFGGRVLLGKVVQDMQDRFDMQDETKMDLAPEVIDTLERLRPFIYDQLFALEESNKRDSTTYSRYESVEKPLMDIMAQLRSGEITPKQAIRKFNETFWRNLAA